MEVYLNNNMKTIAQELNIKDFPFEIKDKNDNEIYFEDSVGDWYKREYDSNDNQIYFENSNGYWCKYKYDSNDNIIYFEDSVGDWWKKEFDFKNNEIYFEDSDGKIIDNRKPIELTLDDIAKKFNIDVKKLKIKK